MNIKKFMKITWNKMWFNAKTFNFSLKLILHFANELVCVRILFVWLWPCFNLFKLFLCFVFWNYWIALLVRHVHNCCFLVFKPMIWKLLNLKWFLYMKIILKWCFLIWVSKNVVSFRALKKFVSRIFCLFIGCATSYNMMERHINTSLSSSFCDLAMDLLTLLLWFVNLCYFLM